MADAARSMVIGPWLGVSSPKGDLAESGETQCEAKTRLAIWWLCLGGVVTTLGGCDLYGRALWCVD